METEATSKCYRALRFAKCFYWTFVPVDDSLLFSNESYWVAISFSTIILPRGEGGGGVLLEILGWGMPPGSPNPDPISDQKKSFFTPVLRPGPVFRTGLEEIMSS